MVLGVGLTLITHTIGLFSSRYGTIMVRMVNMVCTSDGNITLPSTTFLSSKCTNMNLIACQIHLESIHADVVRTIQFGLRRRPPLNPLTMLGCIMRSCILSRRKFSMTTISNLGFGFSTM